MNYPAASCEVSEFRRYDLGSDFHNYLSSPEAGVPVL